MEDIDKKVRFVELRGLGVSYLKIVEELGVCERTLIRWSKEFSCEIGNQRALAFEKLREEYLLDREHRTRIAGTQLSQITEELLQRDLSEIPTPKLFDMQQKLVKETTEDVDEMVFVEQTQIGGVNELKDMLKKVVRWTA